jgi:chromosome segregation ATPase
MVRDVKKMSEKMGNLSDAVKYDLETREEMQRTIVTLRNEVNDLNAQILLKISDIPAEDHDAEGKLNKIQTLKNILLAQRQEISWKNDDLANYEEKVVFLAAEYFKMKATKESLEKDLAQLRDNAGKSTNAPTDQSTVNDMADKIVELQEEIERLKQQNSELEEKSNAVDEKNRMLKAALLMTVDTETKDVQAPAATLTDDKVIEEKEVAMNSGDSGEKVVKIQEGPSTVTAPANDSESPERRRQCPNCGAAGAFILEVDDKENIIYQDSSMKMYGKKYKCGDCRHEWK